ncbi:MAG TPA: EAL domain-containing protein [Gammaproteobacteria bacterium]|nr:EAL domain-containing protein [Gammaproteobacteria bacterium]
MQHSITPAPVNLPRTTVLVVENEAIIAMDLRQQLESLGYLVIGTVAEGEEAITLVREKKPSLVLMDIRLEGSMGGNGTAIQISRGFNVPVVFLIAPGDRSVSPPTETGIMPYGHLTRPFQAKELRAAVEVALYKSRLERELSESEQWFAATMRCAGEAVIATDIEARIIYLNPVAETLTGWKAEDARGREVEQVLRLSTGTAGAPIMSPSRRALRENTVVGIEHGAHLLNRDGAPVPVDCAAAPLRGEDGRLAGAVVVAREAGERLRREARLRDDEERARLFFELAPSGMAMVALDGRFLQANAALATMLGYELHELQTRTHAAVSYPGDLPQEQDQLRNLLSNQIPTAQFEKRYLHRDGKQIIWTLVHVSILREAGQPVCYLYQIHNISDRKKAEYEQAHLVCHDPLTGLANRVQLRADLDRLLAQARRHRRLLAVVFLDLDHFKQVNDDLGFEAGDELLKTVAARLKGMLRDSDCVARLGGDEFVLVLPDMDNFQNVMRLMGKLRAAVSRPLVLAGRELMVTLSAGVSIHPGDGGDAHTLLRNADNALHVAKAAGRNRVQFFGAELAQQAADWLDQETALQRALYGNELLLEYQPIVNMDGGHIVAFEALLRWRRNGELVLPRDFLSMAEGTGLIVAFGEWMLREACSAAVVWMAPLPLHINWSGPQLKEGRLAEMVAAVLKKTGLPAERLCLELTENLILDSDERQLERLAQLRMLGVSVAIDDCGSGHSSLSHLKRYKPQTLNLDIQFVRDVVTDANTTVILAATVAIAHKLGFQVVAKGVETAEQASRLRACGCDLGQGFYYSRPVAAAAVVDLIQAGRLPLGA